MTLPVSQASFPELYEQHLVPPLFRPFGDKEKFDVVTCQQGIQFFPDRPAAMREMHRVLKDNGRLGISAWRSDIEFPFLLELRKVAERHVGPIADRRHSLGDAAELENLLSDAGFRDVMSRAISHTIHFADAKLWTRLNAMALVGMSAKSKELSPDERSRVTETVIADSTEVLDRFCDRAGGVDFPIAANVAVARR
jgi:SAM-dependent methyltransferase